MAYRKLVIFDMDGLMFDTEKLHFDSYGIAAKEFGYTMTKEIFCRLLGGSLGILLGHIGICVIIIKK